MKLTANTVTITANAIPPEVREAIYQQYDRADYGLLPEGTKQIWVDYSPQEVQVYTEEPKEPLGHNSEVRLVEPGQNFWLCQEASDISLYNYDEFVAQLGQH